MSSPFLAEIRIFPFNFAPKGWAMCNGQIMPISQNTALFSLLGVNYGGNGQSNFALPNMQGSFPVQPGQGPGLSQYDLGESGGSANVTLLASQLPPHTHTMSAQDATGTATSPTGNFLAQLPLRPEDLYGSSATPTAMATAAIAVNGASTPHNNLPPFLAMNYCIALQGIFPQRP